MKVFILLSVVAVALASQECGENEHYNSCGTACPLTCDNYENPPRACVLMCVPGCHCDPGYVKTADGQCVKPEECPAKVPHKVCGENEQFNECGTDCPLTCENYINPPQICNLMCRIGCGCKDGYVKSRDGRCVKPEDCPVDAPVVKTCLGKPETGMCRGYFPMFHYDVQTGTCKQFIYGGCGGNGNRYATEEECMTHCQDLRPKQASSACDLPAESGVCRGFFPRYYFDKATGQCQRFIYGGCGGNENNFETEEECNKQCGARAVGLCQLPAVTGPCRAAFPRFYFDQISGTCKMFIYGGCDGNGNNFHTLEECHNLCAARSVSLCELPAKTGPCRASIPRYFFDQASGTCKQFIYGGCDGNENNFETLEQCHNVCAARSVSLCELPAVTGPCRARIPRYFFDQASGTCKQFIYGGCRGNENNFKTLEECHNVCA